MLATFALGTAAGDLTAISLHLGFFDSVLLFAAIIAIPAIGWWRFDMNPIFAFWFAYVVTRPLGASFADWFSKPPSTSGLGLGDGTVSGLALIVFIALVAYVAVTRCDVQGDIQREPHVRIAVTTIKSRAGPRRRSSSSGRRWGARSGPTSAIDLVANRQYGRMKTSGRACLNLADPARRTLAGRAQGIRSRSISRSAWPRRR